MPSPHKKVYLLGTGPGDPELITLKTVRALQEADVILYDHLVNPEILQHCRPGAEKIFVGKSKGRHTLPQEEINQLMAEKAALVPVVARVKGGDPFVFGRGGEEYEYLTCRGFACEIIPGITAASGAAAAIGLPLSHRDYSSEIIFMTGHKKTDGDYSDFSNRDLANKTMVIYMGVTALAEITRELGQIEGNRQLPAVIVENATTPAMRVLRGTISNIAALAIQNRVEAPALVILGQVGEFLAKIEAIKNGQKSQLCLQNS